MGGTQEESTDSMGTWEGPGAGSSYHVSIILLHRCRQLHLHSSGRRGRLFQRQPASSVNQTAEASKKCHYHYNKSEKTTFLP